MKQTAVEVLIDQLTAIGQLEIPKGSNAVTLIIEQSKAMEKEQIMDAYMRSLSGGTDPRWKDIFKKQAEQYYNETFKSE